MTVYWGPNSHLSGEWNIFMPFLFVGQFLLASHGIFIPLLFFANFFFTFLWRKLPEEKEVARKVSDAKTNSRKLNVFVVFDSVSNVAAWVVHPLATTHFEPPRFSGATFSFSFEERRERVGESSSSSR